MGEKEENIKVKILLYHTPPGDGHRFFRERNFWERTKFFCEKGCRTEVKHFFKQTKKYRTIDRKNFIERPIKDFFEEIKKKTIFFFKLKTQFTEWKILLNERFTERSFIHKTNKIVEKWTIVWERTK